MIDPRIHDGPLHNCAHRTSDNYHGNPLNHAQSWFGQNRVYRKFILQTTPKHIHFLGIAGIGVSALAQLAQARGIQVSGSDPNADPAHNPAVARLAAGGAKLYTTHEAGNLADDVNLVVASAAVADTNPEINAARERNIPVVSRAEFLGQLMAAHKGPKIAVAGTHGKTTTTGMIGVMLQHAGRDPTVFVGGEVPELGGNVRVGSPEGPFVAEACEAYDSFLYLKPDIAVITNIEADHLDHYGTEEHVFDAFRKFMSNVTPETGEVIACLDDPGVSKLADEMTLRHECLFYGLDSVKEVVYASETSFLFHDGLGAQRVTLRVPGKHNLFNALAALYTGLVLGNASLSLPEMAAGLAEFRGATRRQDALGEGRLNVEDAGTVLVMDDYAHHPTEIRATLDALRNAYTNRRLITIFQPHLYSRTRDFLDGFADALSQADVLLVTDIYAAREQPIEGVHAKDIVVKAVTHNPNLPATFLPDKQDIPAMLRGLARPGDVCVFMGAGDIREQGERFLALLQPVSETDSR